ncbi:MAG: acyloxyacyl hydrolase [Prevotella sp.]
MLQFIMIFMLCLLASNAQADNNVEVSHSKLGENAWPDMQHTDTATTGSRHWGAELELNPGHVISMDIYQKKMMKRQGNMAIGLKLNHMALPSDSDDYAADFGYPTIGLALKYHFNHNVTMHREADPCWGQLVPVDYDTRLGNIVSAFGSFSRPLFRNRKWEADYSMNFGIAYSHSKYNTHNAIDNDLIGSRWLIFFGAGAHITYALTPEWGLKAGIDYYHHSNGALNRPNKGANYVGPSLALCYRPYYEEIVQQRERYRSRKFSRYAYMDLAFGVGAKVMNEDWLKTQFNTAPGGKDYRTSRFRMYAAYSAQASFMYRYARRWASGIGADAFYGTYADHVAQLDKEQGHDLKHDPWSLGIAAKHQVFYHNLSLAMSLGYYLHREMGANAKEIEKPYYERIGLHYTFSRLGGLTVGCNVKAHLTKADFTEFVVSVPIVVAGTRVH